MPTWECKECQYYEWALMERDWAKADLIGDNFVNVLGIIKQFVLLNFEIWLALFWVFLILLLFVAMSSIFLGIYWAYLFLRHTIK